MPGLLPSYKRRDGDGRETITTTKLSHLTEINQPTLNEKRAPTAGAGALNAPLKRESIGVSYAKHTTRYDELPWPAGGRVSNVITPTRSNKPTQ